MSLSYYRKKRQQQQMLEMQAMANPNIFFFKGNSFNLGMRLIEIQSNPNLTITDAYIVVVGKLIKQQNIVCLIFTITLGMCFLFPLIFMCCGWWKTIVYPVYEIPITAYQKLQAIINNSAIRTLHLQICDNGFNKQKAQLLYNMLSKSQIKSFNFSNSAINNYKQNQYLNFVQNMKPIKMLPIQSTIRWGAQYVS